jgi:hypothetical protein
MANLPLDGRSRAGCMDTLMTEACSGENVPPAPATRAIFKPLDQKNVNMQAQEVLMIL